MGGQTRGIYSILDDGGDSHVGAGVDFKHYAICNDAMHSYSTPRPTSRLLHRGVCGKLLGINAFDSNMGVYSV